VLTALVGSDSVVNQDDEDEGRRKRISGTKQTFGRDLKAAIPSLRTTRPRDGDDRYRVYEGIALKEAGER
jgi:putative DNA primase/helicase